MGPDRGRESPDDRPEQHALTVLERSARSGLGMLWWRITFQVLVVWGARLAISAGLIACLAAVAVMWATIGHPHRRRPRGRDRAHRRRLALGPRSAPVVGLAWGPRWGTGPRSRPGRGLVAAAGGRASPRGRAPGRADRVESLRPTNETGTAIPTRAGRTNAHGGNPSRSERARNPRSERSWTTHCGGQGGALFVLGEAGLGKSALLEYALELAAGRMTVGVGRADVAEAAFPFGLSARPSNPCWARTTLAPAPRARPGLRAGG